MVDILDSDPTGTPGDRDVLERCWETVHRYCRAHTATPEDAEDAAQDTFIRFLQRGERELRNPEAWLISVASRACADTFRGRGHVETIRSQQTRSDGGDHAEDLAGRLSLVRILEQLDSTDRHILASLYLSGLSGQQLARRLKVSPGNLRVMALRARRRARGVATAMGHGTAAIPLVPPLWRSLRRQGFRLQARLRQLVRQPTAGPVDGSLLGYWAVTIGALPLVAATMLMPAGSLGGVAAGRPEAQARLPSTGDSGGDEGHPPPASPPAPGARNVARLDSPDAPAPAGHAGGEGRQRVLPGPSTRPGPLDRAGVIAAQLLPSGPVSSSDTSFRSVVLAADGSILASGHRQACLSTCAVLFRSTDSGHSWQQLPARGFLGGKPVVPSAFPADPTLFAAGPAGLQRSDDGGASFRTVLPTAAAAAADPLSPAGDASVVVGTVPLSVYHQASGHPTPGPMLPPDTRVVDDLAFSPAGQLAVAGRRLSPLVRGGTTPQLATCNTIICSPTDAPVGTSTSPLQLAAAPGGGGGRLIAFGGNLVATSSDGGSSWRAVSVPGASSVPAATVVAGTDGPVLVVSVVDAIHQSPLLLSSSDTGASWRRLPAQGLPPGDLVSGLAGLPGDRLVAALEHVDGHPGFGLAYSGDGGRSWTK